MTEQQIDPVFLDAFRELIGDATADSVAPSMRELMRQGYDVDGGDSFSFAAYKGMSGDEVQALFHRRYWICLSLQDIHPNAARKIFSLAANMGRKNAVTCVQRALRAMDFDVAATGTMDAATHEALRRAGVFVVPPLRAEAAGFYREQVAALPGLKRFLNGWLGRAYR